MIYASNKANVYLWNQAQDEVIKSHAKVKIVEKADISNQFEFFENYNPEEHKRKVARTSPPRPNIQQKGISFDEDANEAEFNAVKIDGIKIDTLQMNGVVERAKNTYIDRVKKSESIKKKQKIERASDVKGAQGAQQNQTASKVTNGKRVDATQNQPKKTTETKQRTIDESESEAESEISSRKPGYLDTDLENARLAARTRDLKDLFERWNYENNVCDTVYNDTIPEYDEIDDSQTETTKT